MLSGPEHRQPPSASADRADRPAIELHVETLVRGRCLIEQPARATGRLLLGYHGYGERAEAQLARLRRIPATHDWMIASVEALHRFYLGRTGAIGACWMTSAGREHAIEDNVAYLRAVCTDITRDHPAHLIVHAGFSQGVAMAFRAALRSVRSAGVIALGGDVPPELRSLPDEDWRGLHVLIGRGARDEWYTRAQFDADVAWLASRPLTLRTLEFEGGHDWSAEFTEAAGRFLEEITGPS